MICRMPAPGRAFSQLPEFRATFSPAESAVIAMHPKPHVGIPLNSSAGGSAIIDLTSHDLLLRKVRWRCAVLAVIHSLDLDKRMLEYLTPQR